jgi:hypothetical protein
MSWIVYLLVAMPVLIPFCKRGKAGPIINYLDKQDIMMYHQLVRYNLYAEFIFGPLPHSRKAIPIS